MITERKKKVGLSLVGELQQCHVSLLTTWLGFFECKPTKSPTTAASTFTFLQTRSSPFPYRIPGLFLLSLSCVSQRQLLLWCRILDNKLIHLSFGAWHMGSTWEQELQHTENPPTYRCSLRCHGMQPVCHCPLGQSHPHNSRSHTHRATPALRSPDGIKQKKSWNGSCKDSSSQRCRSAKISHGYVGWRVLNLLGNRSTKTTLLVFPELELDFGKNEIRPQKVNNSSYLPPLFVCVDSVQNMLLPALKNKAANPQAVSTVGKGGLSYIWKQYESTVWKFSW